MTKENRTKMIGIKMTQSEMEVLDTICNTQKISKSAFIRKLINNYIAEMDMKC